MPPWTPPLGYARRPTLEVAVGDVRLGGSQPIRVQSMTTPPPEDVAGTVGQIRRLVEAGCEIVRLTIPTAADAAHLPAIRAALRRERIRVPLVADIHFSPAAALAAVEHVEKVRLNPGNFADSKRFAQREYTDREYALELERLEDKLRPVIRRARELGVAMRIGTNHGSLSDRILNRYGDTPLGMVESALEFVRICEAHGYRSLVLSMKASNPQITLQGYRLLAARMAEEGMAYPFHLGVTEAGDGREGRIKSAIGIGALLEEGIGDTVRVSLTEDPVAEIPVARALVAPFNAVLARPDAVAPRRSWSATPAARVSTLYERRRAAVAAWGAVAAGGSEPVRAEVRLPAAGAALPLARLLGAERGAELVSLAASTPSELRAAQASARALRERGVAAAIAVDLRDGGRPVPARDWAEALPGFDRFDLVLPPDPDAAAPAWREWIAAAGGSMPLLLELERSAGEPTSPEVALAAILSACPPPRLPALALRPADGSGCAAEVRRLAESLAGLDAPPPLVLIELAPEDPYAEPLAPAARLGGLLSDGVGDSVRLEGAHPPRLLLDAAYDILQGARVRMSRTEFISCPSCGRTLFDLESTTRRIKERTAHLKGVKIAIMGCIVNGPGEMADADFGYVGGAPGKVNLYVGRECVARHVDEGEADARLISLIKEHGRWREPPAADTAA
jgi:(E)-4-hydroxy-3-methylbut-2-enyl-diphosphate synthase